LEASDQHAPSSCRILKTAFGSASFRCSRQVCRGRCWSGASRCTPRSGPGRAPPAVYHAVELPRVPSYSTSLLPPCDPAEPRVSYGRRLQAGKCRPEVLPSAGWGLDHGPLELVAQVPSVHQDLMARASVPWHKGLAQVHPPVLSQSILIRLAR